MDEAFMLVLIKLIEVATQAGANQGAIGEARRATMLERATVKTLEDQVEVLKEDIAALKKRKDL